MPKDNVDRETRKALPRWLVVAVLAVCAVVTAAAMSMSGLKGPSVAWERANKTIEMVWANDPSSPNNAQGVGGVALPAVPVAALPGVPVIVAGAPLTHVDRGACTNCHGVITAQNTAVPAITALSTMTHEYRGVCINCHQLKVARDLTPVAGATAAPPALVQQPLPSVGMGAASPKTARPPAEAEWQGLEVGPAATGVAGVNVDGAEGAARTTGLRTGDLVTSINGLPIRTMTDFVRITDNGALAQGAVIVRRDGQRLAFELGAARTNAPPPAPPPLATAVPWGATAPRTPEAQF